MSPMTAATMHLCPSCPKTVKFAPPKPGMQRSRILCTPSNGSRNSNQKKTTIMRAARTKINGDFTFHGGRRHLHARRLPAMITADSEVRMCQPCTTDGDSRIQAMRTLQPPTPQRSQRLARLLSGCRSFVGIFHVTSLQRSGCRFAPWLHLLRWRAQSRRSCPSRVVEDPDRRYDWRRSLAGHHAVDLKDRNTGRASSGSSASAAIVIRPSI